MPATLSSGSGAIRDGSCRFWRAFEPSDYLAIEVDRAGDSVLPALAAKRVLASLAMFAGDRRTSAMHTLDILRSMRRKSSWVYADATSAGPRTSHRSVGHCPKQAVLIAEQALSG